MKKHLSLILILISIVILIGCAPTNQKVVSTPTQVTPPSEPVQTETQESSNSQPPQIIEKSPLPIEKEIPPILEKAITKAQETKQPESQPTKAPAETTSLENKPINSLTETFDGQMIDSSKYETKTVGNGTIKQDNQLITSGKSDYGIIWNAIYTKKKYNLMNDFNISAKVNLTGKTTIGNTIALIGIEDLSLITNGKNPERGYCEISLGSDGKILRMSKSVGHLDEDTPLSGLLTLFYNTKLEKLTCTFNGKTITQYQSPIGGDYYASLRSGLNYATGGGLESEGIGSFSATFDNWYIKQE